MDITNKDLNLLKIFCVLAEEKNLSTAAERLNTSQPALSYQLKRLREEFGNELFIRTRAGYSLTEKAISLAPKAKAILSEIKKIYFKTDFDLKTHQQEFVLASTTYFEITVIEKILKLLKSKAPKVILKTVSLNSELPTKELDAGIYDLAVSAFFKEVPKSFHLKKIGTDHQVCVMRKKHPYLNGNSTLTRYLEFPHIKIDIPINSISRIDRYLEEKAYKKRNIQGRYNNFLSPALALKTDDFILTVPSRLGHFYAEMFNLEVRPLPTPKIELDIKMLWHERQNQDLFHKWFRAEIANLFE